MGDEDLQTLAELGAPAGDALDSEYTLDGKTSDIPDLAPESAGDSELLAPAESGLPGGPAQPDAGDGAPDYADENYSDVVGDTALPGVGEAPPPKPPEPAAGGDAELSQAPTVDPNYDPGFSTDGFTNDFTNLPLGQQRGPAPGGAARQGRGSSIEEIVARNPSLTPALGDEGRATTRALEQARLIKELHDRGIYDAYMDGSSAQRTAIMRNVIQGVAADVAAGVPMRQGRTAVFNNTKAGLELSALTLGNLPEFQRGDTPLQKLTQDRTGLQDQIVNSLRRNGLWDKYNEGDKARRKEIMNWVVGDLARQASGPKFDRNAYYDALNNYKGALLTLGDNAAFAQPAPAAAQKKANDGGFGAQDVTVAALSGVGKLAPGLASLSLSAADAALNAVGTAEDNGARQFLQWVRQGPDWALGKIDEAKAAASTGRQREAEAALSAAKSQGFGATVKAVYENPRLFFTMAAEMGGGFGAAGLASKAWSIARAGEASSFLGHVGSKASVGANIASQGGTAGYEARQEFLNLKPESQQQFALYQDIRSRMAAENGGRMPAHADVAERVANTIQSNAGVLSATAGAALLKLGFGAEATLSKYVAGEISQAAGPMAIARRIAGAVVTEGIQEGAEQFGQNLGTEFARTGLGLEAAAAALADPSVRSAAAAGGILGAPFGALGVRKRAAPAPGDESLVGGAPDGTPPRGIYGPPDFTTDPAGESRAYGDAVASEALALPAPPDFVVDPEGRVGETAAGVQNAVADEMFAEGRAAQLREDPVTQSDQRVNDLLDGLFDKPVGEQSQDTARDGDTVSPAVAPSAQEDVTEPGIPEVTPYDQAVVDAGARMMAEIDASIRQLSGNDRDRLRFVQAFETMDQPKRKAFIEAALAQFPAGELRLQAKEGVYKGLDNAYGPRAERHRANTVAALLRELDSVRKNPLLQAGREVTEAVRASTKDAPPTVKAVTESLVAPDEPGRPRVASGRVVVEKRVAERAQAVQEARRATGAEDNTVKGQLAALEKREAQAAAVINGFAGNPEWEANFAPQKNSVAFDRKTAWASKRGRAGEHAKIAADPAHPLHPMVIAKENYNRVLGELNKFRRSTGIDPETGKTSFRIARRAVDRGLAPIDKARLLGAARRLEQRYDAYGLRVRVVQDDAEVAGTADLRAQIGTDTGWAGAFYTDAQTGNPTVVLNADYIGSVRDAEATILHELYGHFGPRYLLGEKNFGKVLGAIDQLAKTDKNIRAIARAVEREYPVGLQFTRADQLSEIMARIAERAPVPGYDPTAVEQARDLGRDAIDWIANSSTLMRRFLTGLGWRADNMDYDALRRFLTDEVPRHLERGGAPGEIATSMILTQHLIDSGQAVQYATSPERYKFGTFGRAYNYLTDEWGAITTILKAETRASGNINHRMVVDKFGEFMSQRSNLLGELTKTMRETYQTAVERDFKSLSDRTGIDGQTLRTLLGKQNLALRVREFHDRAWAQQVRLKPEAAAQREDLLNRIFTNDPMAPDEIRRRVIAIAKDANNQVSPDEALRMREGMTEFGITDRQAAEIENEIRSTAGGALWDQLLEIQDGSLQAMRSYMLKLDYESGRHNQRYIEYVGDHYYMPRKGFTRAESNELDISEFNPMNSSRQQMLGRDALAEQERMASSMVKGFYEEAQRSVRDRVNSELVRQFMSLSEVVPDAIHVKEALVDVQGGAAVSHPVYRNGKWVYPERPKNLDVGKFLYTDPSTWRQFNVELRDQNFVDAVKAERTEDTPFTGAKNAYARATREFGQLITQRNPGYLAIAFQRDLMQDSFALLFESGKFGVPKAKLLASFGSTLNALAPWSGTQLGRDLRAYFTSDIGGQQQLLADIRSNPTRSAASKPLLDYLEARVPREFVRQFGVDDALLSIERDLAGKPSVLRRADDALRNFGTYLDNAHRLAFFNALTANGVDRDAAAKMTVDLMDFNQRSAFGRRYGWAWNFLQTTLTGIHRLTDKAVWTNGEPPIRTRKVVDTQGREQSEFYMDPREAMNAINKPMVLSLIGAGFMQVVLGMWMMGYDDDGEPNARKISPGTWFRDIVVGDGTAKPLKWALPYGEVQLFSAFGKAAALSALGYANGKELATELANVAINNLNPIGRVQVPEDTSKLDLALLTGLAPTLVGLLGQYAANINGFGGAIDARDSTYNREKYRADSGFHSTPQEFKDFASSMRKNFGLDMTPESYKFFLQNSGYVGQTLNRLLAANNRESQDGNWLSSAAGTAGLWRVDSSADSYEARVRRETFNEYVLPELKEWNSARESDRREGGSVKQQDGRWTQGANEKALLTEKPWLPRLRQEMKKQVDANALYENGIQQAKRAGDPDKQWALRLEQRRDMLKSAKRMKEITGREQ